MNSWMKKLNSSIKYTILHPQWLSNRYHRISQKELTSIENSVVLEIGSGDSSLESLIGPSNQSLKLDYPKTNQRYTKKPAIFADAAHLPVKDGSIDAVLFLEVAEHIPQDKKPIKEISRILKPGGLLYFSVPFIYPMHDQPYDYRRYTVHGINALLSEHGFSVKNIKQHGNSFVTALQLLNLSILELCKNALSKNLLSGIILILLFYPVCMLVNIAGGLGIPLTNLNASCFGHFVVAEKYRES